MDLLTAVLMFAPIIVLVSSNPFCPAILDEENVNPEHGWDKTNCNLHHYSSNDMVECLDLMVPSRPSKKKSFLFFGDSRIRQQFKAFVKLLPEYDNQQSYLRFFGQDKHYDYDADYDLLNTKVSMRWRPTIDAVAIADLKAMTTPPYNNTPDFILFGICLHMGSVEKFTSNLRKMEPYVKKLARMTNVIWLKQYDVLETYFGASKFEFERSVWTVSYVKESNNIVQRMFQDSGVTFFESSHQLGKQYIRGCKTANRTDSSGYFNCKDWIHTGFVCIQRASQLLWNSLCNVLLSKSTNQAIKLNTNTCCI